MTTRNGVTQPQAGVTGAFRNMKCYGVTSFALATTDLATGQVVQMFVIPAGFVALGLYASASDMDTNGSPALAISIGDSGSSVRFLSSSTIGQAGTTTSTIASAGQGYKFTSDTTILFTATTGSATAAAGTLTLYIWGFNDA